jgi:glutamate N-acetyltransferase/amino-acid N-acetyltransferase
MTVLAARGFVASGLAAGIKGDGRLDLALVACERPGVVPTAGVFTSNRFAAAPVQVSRAHIAQDQGMSAGVVLNSGCANAASGAQGLRAAELTCEVAARELKVRPCEVLVCSTGTIGTPLEVDKIAAALPTLVASRGSSPECSQAAAQAILTTDTRTKQVVVEGEGFRVGAMAKGAAMLSPNMATMLAVLTTDATATPTVLRGALGGAVGSSFN